MVRMMARACRLALIEAWPYRPCFVRDALMRSIPAAVRGPVLGPPCMRHLPFGIAGPLHGVPFRVRAPHGAASVRSPGGFPFFNQPRRTVWGLPAISTLPPGLVPPALHATSGNDGLAAWADLHILVHHLDGLPTTAPDSVEG